MGYVGIFRRIDNVSNSSNATRTRRLTSDLSACAIVTLEGRYSACWWLRRLIT